MGAVTLASGDLAGAVTAAGTVGTAQAGTFTANVSWILLFAGGVIVIGMISGLYYRFLHFGKRA